MYRNCATILTALLFCLASGCGNTSFLVSILEKQNNIINKHGLHHELRECKYQDNAVRINIIVLNTKDEPHYVRIPLSMATVECYDISKRCICRKRVIFCLASLADHGVQDNILCVENLPQRPYWVTVRLPGDVDFSYVRVKQIP